MTMGTSSYASVDLNNSVPAVYVPLAFKMNMPLNVQHLVKVGDTKLCVAPVANKVWVFTPPTKTDPTRLELCLSRLYLDQTRVISKLLIKRRHETYRQSVLLPRDPRLQRLVHPQLAFLVVAVTAHCAQLYPVVLHLVVLHVIVAGNPLRCALLYRNSGIEHLQRGCIPYWCVLAGYTYNILLLLIYLLQELRLQPP